MADKPGVFALVRRIARRYFEDNISRSAAELAFFLLFSLFPLLMFLSTILARLHLSFSALLPAAELLPLSIYELIEGYLSYISDAPSIKPMLLGVALTLYFLSRAVRSMMRTVNGIYRIGRQRGAVQEVLLSLAMTAGFLLALSASFVLLVVGRLLLRLAGQWLPFALPALPVLRLLSVLSMLAFVFVFLLLFNKLVPNAPLGLREVWPGALFSLAAWVAVSYIFSFYVDNMARYSVLYGSLGVMIVLMLWLYLISTILLLGPLLNHTLAAWHYARGKKGK